MLEPKYKEEYLKSVNENLNNFDINDVCVQIKVKKFCSKYNFEEKEVFDRLEKDDILKASFIKEPSRQNIYEKTFARFLKGIKNISDFKKLPPSGKNSIFIINQEVRKGKSPKAVTSQAKSMDFYFKYNGLDNIEFYVFHKYTNESGGAQDNQRNDVINAINEASNPHVNKHIYVLFVCDGEYYDKKNWDKMAVHVKDSNFVLLRSSQIEEFLRSL